MHASASTPAVPATPVLEKDKDVDIEEARVEASNAEGTFHQAALGERVKRRHFFSALKVSSIVSISLVRGSTFSLFYDLYGNATQKKKSILPRDSHENQAQAVVQN